MSDKDEQKPADSAATTPNADANKPVDLGGLGSLDLTPSWAKAKPEEGLKRYHSDRYTGEAPDDRGSRGGDRRFGGPGRSFGGPRPSFGGPRPAGGPGGHSFGGPRKPFDRDARGPRGDHGAPRFGGFRSATPPPPPVDVEVRVLPEQKALGSIIRKIQTAHRAFPLKDLAYLFLENPASVLLRVAPRKQPAPRKSPAANPGATVEKGAAAAPAAPRPAQPAIFQCKVCGLPALTEEELVNHIVARHLADFYDEETIDCEAPKGSFACVAKCGLSGVLIGPPNLHDFNTKIQEMLRTRYPSMSEEAYRAHLEMIHDPAVVEEWRKSATKKTVYRLKAAKPTTIGTAAVPAATPAPATADAAAPAETPAPVADDRPILDREAAELEFRRTIAPTLVTKPKALVTTAAVGLASPSRPLVWAFQDALAKERRFPASLFFALRGAFHHRKLAFFRANDPRGPDFVTSVAPAPLDAAHAVPELAEIVKFVGDHPSTTVRELVTALSGGVETKQGDILKNVSLLVEKGHLVAFFNDILALPAANPVYRAPRGGKPPAKKQTPGVNSGATIGKAPAAAKPTEPAAKPAGKPTAPAIAEKPAAPAEPPPAPAAGAPETK